jgi:small-conductance mechanosensitive channel
MLEALIARIPGQWEKVIITVLLIGMALLASHLWARYLGRSEIADVKRRIHLVWARNLIWMVALLLIVSVWASTIAGFVLSVAAVAGAMLIVSKELVMCVHGYLYVTLVQPYKIGDEIEFNQLHGQVVDIDMFATTLVELDASGERTGKVVEFPNGLLLTHPVINASPSGAYVVHTIEVPVPARASKDLARLELAAREAADQATAAWREHANAHFDQSAEAHLMPLLTGQTLLSWKFADPDHLMLVVRVACPLDQRAKVEQAVFRGAWMAIHPESA